MVALGGNALLPPGEHGAVDEQFAHVRGSLEPIVALAAAGWKIAITHGNGPQIGDELIRNERVQAEVPRLPISALVAATAGWIGYMIQQSLRNSLERSGVDRDVATVITQVEVDSEDPELRDPSKPVGRVMDEARARRLASRYGWSVGRSDDGWRRLVPSPRPISVVEGDVVSRLVAEGTITIAAGGGGTPVHRRDDGGLEGIDGVIDKDRTAAILARQIGADLLLILTNVEGAYRRFGAPEQSLIRSLSAMEAERLLSAGEFGRGTMGPKVEAAITFVRGGGRRAQIAHLDQGLAAVNGEAGTVIHPG